jgi:hypothetical protein
MAEKTHGLFECIEAVATTCLRRWKLDFPQDRPGVRMGDFVLDMEAAVSDLLLTAWRRNYTGAKWIAGRLNDSTSIAFVPGAWEPLVDLFTLAERIDYFLATLDQGPEAKGLVRACADDAGVLPILADWCDDNGKPQSAAEARHLHSLLRSYVD